MAGSDGDGIGDAGTSVQRLSWKVALVSTSLPSQEPQTVMPFTGPTLLHRKSSPNIWGRCPPHPTRCWRCQATERI